MDDADAASSLMVHPDNPRATMAAQTKAHLLRRVETYLTVVHPIVVHPAVLR